MADETEWQGRGSGARRVWLRPLLVGAGVVLCAAVLFAVLERPPRPRSAPALEARIELAAGEVLVATDGDEQRVLSGAALPTKARVTTGRGARALLRLPSGAALFLRGDTQLELDKQRVSLLRGEYWLEAPPLERDSLVHVAGDVELTASQAGLSFLRDGEQRVVVYVARGSATVGAKNGRVEARSGEQVLVGKDGKPRKSAVAFWNDWTGGMADFGAGSEIAGAGSGTIYAVDEGAPQGAPVQPLDLAKQVVRAVVREGLSETEVDQTFFNPGEREVEGWYWFTIPERASVTGFALETNGVLVEGEFIERRDAAARYDAAKAGGHSPAILEYVDGQTYRARIHPIAAGGTRRVVLRYIELRPVLDGKVEYVYPMGAGKPVRIGEFALSVDLGEEGKRMKLSTLEDARVEQGGSLVTMRRSGYTPRAPFQLEAELPSRPGKSISVARHDGGPESADYVLARYVPDVDWAKLAPARAELVVVVDTSAGGDEASYRLRSAAAEASLRALSDQDRFALVTVDVRSSVVYPQQGLAPASDAEVTRALEALAQRPAGGATDLAQSFDVALERLHGAEQPAIVYVGDGIATSGERGPEQLVERLRRSLGTSRARFFALAAGVDANVTLLAALARTGGGESLRVLDGEQVSARALELTAAVKRPTITEFRIDLGAGLDEVFSNVTGKVSRGQEVTVLARTHHELPARAKVSGRIGGKTFSREYPIEADTSIRAAFVPRLWAAEYVRRLVGERRGPDADRGRIVKLGIDYGLMTPFTSILALESEAAYEQMGIQRRRSSLRGLRLGALDRAAEASIRYAMFGALPAPAFGCSKEQPSAGKSEAQPVALQAPPPGPEIERLSAQRTAAPVAPAAAEEVSALPPGQDETAALQAAADQGMIGLLNSPSSGAVAGSLAKEHGVGARPVSGRRGGGARAKPAEPAPEPVEDPKPGLPVARCSDASAQPLALRTPLWWRRLAAATDGAELIQRYQSAKNACEIDDWYAERVFLELLQRRLTSAADAEHVLSFFARRVEVQKHLARLILRRSVDPALVQTVQRKLLATDLNWTEIDLKLEAIASPEERLAKLREYAELAPGDPNGMIRLVRALLAAGKREQALALGRRLREDGLFTPELARQLGDVLAASKLEEEALRTYSEIVEFDADNLGSRRLLGDTYLAHAWYEPAYRQFRVLVDANPEDAHGWLRLAAAAAGTGRVDEALRIERRVASAEGTPGPDDPRRWARLWSAARLSRLLGKATEGAELRQQLERKLSSLQLFSGPASLVIVTWEDLQADLTLTAELEGKARTPGELSDAAQVGLSAALVSGAEARSSSFAARRRGLLTGRAVPLRFHRIDWDGKRFAVELREAVLPAREAAVRL